MLFTSYFGYGDVLVMKFDDKFYLASQIKYHRKKMHLTQAELAELVDLSVQHISRIESGCYIPSLKSFFMLVNVLHMDLSEFGFDVSATKNPVKSRLMEVIASATDTELIFYENMINAVDKSLSKTKKIQL